MRLLIDTDVFCKLGVAGLLEDAIEAMGFTKKECGRLPALPYMLKRGALQRTYGTAACETLQPLAKSIPPIPDASSEWLDLLAQLPEVDAGEAQLFATAAQRSIMIISGDKRAIRAVKNIEQFVGALHGRISILEAVLLLLLDAKGAASLRESLVPLRARDVMIGVCFSDGNQYPRGALRSYFDALAREIPPLVLWDPDHRDG